jgi:hypothetical protein
MRRGWLSSRLVTAAAVLAAPSASAADIPVKAPPVATVEPPRWEAIFNTEVVYFSWDRSRGYPPPVLTPLAPAGPSRGTMVYAPAALAINGLPTNDVRLEFLARTGYVWSRNVLPDTTGEASQQTDSLLGTKMTWLGWNGIQPFFALNVNLPTGKTNLQGNKSLTQPDPDAGPIATFGEGWNVGPTAGVNFLLSPEVIVSFGFGYTYRGPFVRGGFDVINQLVEGTRRLDPGDVFTGNVTVSYRGERLSLTGSVSYSKETETTIDRNAYYIAGDRILIAGGAGYAWNDNWSSRVIATYSHMQKNKQGVAPALQPPEYVLEAFNSNSDMIKVNIDTTYRQGPFAVGPLATVIYRNHNAYNPATFMFLPAKTSWSIGGLVQYDVTRNAQLRWRVERLWIIEDERPFAVPQFATPEIRTDGWLVGISGVFRL